MNLMAIKVPLSDAQIVLKFFNNLSCMVEIPFDLPSGTTLGVLKPLDDTGCIVGQAQGQQVHKSRAKLVVKAW